MDADELALLELQNEFMASGKASAAVVKKVDREPSVAPSNSQDLKVKESIPGERVNLNLDAGSSRTNGSTAIPGGIIKDIFERIQDEAVQVCDVPIPSSTSTLRPKKIDWRNKSSTKSGSRFAAQRKAAQGDASEKHSLTDFDMLHKQIDEENKNKLASMSEADLLTERQELLSTLDPALLAVFKRHTKPAASPTSVTEPDFGPQFTSEAVSSIPIVKSRNASRKEHTDVQSSQSVLEGLERASRARNEQDFTTETEAMQDINDPNHIHTEECFHSAGDEGQGLSVHFPDGVSSDLDSNSETFLADLKNKYFPTLQHDPSSLAWMSNPTEAEDVADYHESNASLMPAQIRFDFKGNFLAPRTSRQVQSDLGLHHHADAPLAAGYTVPELAHLSRSSFPTQACMAIQTIGRVMYKIGKGFYGTEISAKLRHLVEKSMVERTLLERSNDKHLSIRSYATEALWQANLGREGQTIEGQ